MVKPLNWVSIQSVWLPQAEVLFDVLIVDTDVQSYLIHSPKSVLYGAELKRRENIQLLVVHVNKQLNKIK